MANLTYTVTLNKDDSDELIVEVAGKYDVCPCCEGTGKVLAEGLRGVAFTEDDFSEAGPDFREEYFSGRYDVQCSECHGLRVVIVPDEQFMSEIEKAQLQQWHEDRAESARIDAMFDAEMEAERRAGC